MPGGIDLRTLAEGMSYPGIDPRTWVSYGLVGAVDSNEQVVAFDTDLKQPLVSVILQPSQVPVVCRVAASVAGNGEGEWNPYVTGDEVIVLIPEGNEKAGCCIIGRLNNAIDAFPMDSVAGQDPTTNTFAFKRQRTPRIEEFAGSMMFRSAKTGAFLSIDEAGVVSLKDGQNATLQMSADVFGYQGPSDPTTPPKFVMQLSLTGGQFLLQLDDAIVTLCSSKAVPEQNIIGLPGPLMIGTLGNPALEHALSTEAFANLLYQELLGLAASIAATTPGPLTGVTLGAAIVTWLNAVPPLPSFTLGITTASTSALVPQVLAAITAAFLTATQKPSVPSGQQTNPGIGAAGLNIG